MSETRSDGPTPIPGQYEIPDDPVGAQEKFWQQWGEAAGFTEEQFGLLWRDAGQQYYSRLAHHNFDHAQRVLWDAMCLADLCERNDIAVNRKALMGAALFHDAGYHQKILQEDYRSKEFYAAMIFKAYAEGSDYGMDEHDIYVGWHAIMATESKRVPLSIEDKILVRADIMNVGGDYETSVEPVTESLLTEEEQLADEGEDTSSLRLPFMHRSITVLASYLVHDLSLGPFDKKEWFEQALSNVLRMIRETAAEEGRSAAELVKELGSSAVTKLFDKLRD